eukprot:3949109-Amphidinium_carterae.2
MCIRDRPIASASLVPFSRASSGRSVGIKPWPLPTGCKEWRKVRRLWVALVEVERVCLRQSCLFNETFLLVEVVALAQAVLNQ